MGIVGGSTKAAARMSPLTRAILIGEIALTVKRHIERLDAGEPTELRALIVKSRGRRKNLTPAERKRLLELVRKLEPGQFAKTAATQAMPLRRKR
jgi:hypothetical protein